MTRRPLGDTAVALLVIAGGLLLYVPFAGSYGLWDPWETHYAEVARQMTHRGDYISLWWPGSPRDADVFWSKPALSFWLMSLTMRLFGIGLPGNPAGEMALGHRAEWAARLPFCLAGVLGIFAVYLLGKRLVSRRAGLLAAVVVATAPMYSLVARQAMTDMAFVGPMAMALALGALALFEAGQDGELPRRGRGWWSWPHDPLFYGTVALFAAVVLPQLIVNAVQLRVEVPWGSRLFVMYGAVPMIPYDLGFVAFVFLAARTRRRAPFYLYLAAILCALAVLAKGLAGLGLPVIVFALFLVFGGGWAPARRARLGFALVGAVIAFAVVAVPWHHAMLIRHGAPFWSELFGDNHWRRMVIGRHGDRGTFDYFLRELGYGLWPWVALAPAAFAWSVLRQPLSGSDVEARKQGALRLGAIWFASAYAVVSVSMTKFHHYVLPAIPGLAVVTGAFADDLLARRAVRTAAVTAAIGLPLLLFVTLGLVDEPHAAEKFLWLFSYDYIQSPTGRAWPAALDFSTALAIFGVLFAAGTLLLALPRARAVASWTLPLAAVAFTFFLLDDTMPKLAPYWSQKGPIAAYYRLRRSPDERLIAYMLYWRGETFYTSNEIYEGPAEERTVFDQEGADERLKAWLERHRGRRVFFLFERYQQGRIRDDLPPEARPSLRVVHDFNNKFSLAQADL
ncbi:MAG TPA: glycosyltransferase family 39 protein [Polyangia bacterium]|nr:glycosyltransferase family 39 protein [Polyangia bacterium]